MSSFAISQTLSPCSNRAACNPIQDKNGAMIGDTLFKRIEQPIGIQNTCAYTIATSDQIQNSIHSSVVWGKLDRSSGSLGHIDELSNNHKLRPEFIKITTQAAMASWRTIRKTHQSVIKKQSSVVNTPRIGSHKNTAFTAIQVNVLAAKEYSCPPRPQNSLQRDYLHSNACTAATDNPAELAEAAAISGLDISELTENCSMFLIILAHYPDSLITASAACLQKKIGLFAYMHIDKWDSVGAVSSLLFCSDLPESYDSRVLFFPEIGMITSLKGTGCIKFCGLHRHGGRPSAPTRHQDEVPDWLYCLVVVHYPHTAFLDRRSVMAVMPSALSGPSSGQILFICPELQLLSHDRPIPPSVESVSFVRDGIAVMQLQLLFLFAICAITMLVVNCLCQLPSSWMVKVDTDQMISAITMEHESQRVNAGLWSEALTTQQFNNHFERSNNSPFSSNATDATPTIPHTSPSSSSAHVISVQRWRDHCESHQLFVPSYYSNYNGPHAAGDSRDELPFEDHAEDTRNYHNNSNQDGSEPADASLANTTNGKRGRTKPLDSTNKCSRNPDGTLGVAILSHSEKRLIAKASNGQLALLGSTAAITVAQMMIARHETNLLSELTQGYLEQESLLPTKTQELAQEMPPKHAGCFLTQFKTIIPKTLLRVHAKANLQKASRDT
ncbi:uncharacterized protein PHACADRAFT_32254 [Phanerochaete carnosa HHB-10118-sp]|uniref:Uncharacterized protein n=1 Tax=Phanerochaete carnosa (strain HHB-10118-sp) TaxID=650164 RepID=K5UND8_PHACS|nr:uncharacterized protein PHACADRAFT_32254 [Phanerochaete carnosa HHB-10118-sp]EKM51261.1 hypothetical protein PHACADRAFT_32254 [Phanerochaete carnosa HHB-10118-sp]